MTTSSPRAVMNSRLQIAVLIGVIAWWAALHLDFWSVLIYHDTWITNFTETYGVARNSACLKFAYWLMSVDTGSPTVIYAISASLTQPIRVLLVNWWACTRPQPFDAMLIYKLQIFVIYFGFALGMFVLGRMLFRHWLSAVYLATAALFAGFCVYNVHSDQSVIMVFWVPWYAAALVMADRYSNEPRAALHVNLAAVLFCLQLLDQSPHLAALGAATAFLIYATMRFEHLVNLLRQSSRFWPAALVLLVTVGGLYVIQNQIYDFRPSQRAAVTVHPSQFGQTGFIQPSAFFGELFPLTFTAAFEEIASGYGWRAFIYRLDVPILYIGTLPLVLVISLFSKGGLRSNGLCGAPLGWLIFSAVLMLMSLQTSQLYFAMFHIPFFNLFRDYFHYFVYALFGFLVLSGYGFDRLLTTTSIVRANVLRATFILSSIVYLGGATVLGALAIYGKGDGPGFWSYLWSMAEDAVIVVTTLGALLVAAWHPNLRTRHALFALFVLIATQSIHAAGVYRLLGEPASSIFKRYQMDAAMLAPYSAAEWANPTQLRRVECPTNASCFLAQRDGASLKRDLDGTFFRHRLNPVFQDTLSPDVKMALVGISHPALWASAGLQGVASVADLDRELDAYRSELDMLLSRWTYVIDSQVKEKLATQPTVLFANMDRGTDEMSFHYRADSSAFANLSVTAAPGWSATINGAATPIIKANFDFITFRLPAGEGVVTLRYDNAASVYFFWSRWILAALGIAGAISLTWRGRRTEA